MERLADITDFCLFLLVFIAKMEIFGRQICCHLLDLAPSCFRREWPTEGSLYLGGDPGVTR